MTQAVIRIVAGAAAISVFAAAASAQSVTRIEPRAYYGATISIEEGVRVFRPLPKHSNIIINPGHRTPLTLRVGGDGKAMPVTTNNNINVENRIIRRARRGSFTVNPPIR